MKYILLVFGLSFQLTFAQPNGAHVETPPALEFGWPTASLKEVDMDESIVKLLLDSLSIGHYSGINGIAIARNGKLVFEKYYNGFNPYIFQDIRSGTKSITALFIGTLIDAGLLGSEDEKICQYYDYISCEQNQITIKHLLMMRSGLDCNDYTDESPGSEGNTFDQKDWYKYTLSQKQLYNPGERFSYCTMGVNLLSHVIEKKTGRDIRELADSLLFDPMEINFYNWYTNTPSRKPYMGGFFTCFLRDFLKFGQLMIDDGKWKGKQIVSSKWINTIRNSALPIDDSNMKRYGYLWWQEDIKHKGKVYKAMIASGNGGQKIIAVKELSVVVAIFGSQFFSAYHENEQPMLLFENFVLKAIR